MRILHRQCVTCSGRTFTVSLNDIFMVLLTQYTKVLYYSSNLKTKEVKNHVKGYINNALAMRHDLLPMRARNSITQRPHPLPDVPH